MPAGEGGPVSGWAPKVDADSTLVSGPRVVAPGWARPQRKAGLLGFAKEQTL